MFNIYAVITDVIGCLINSTSCKMCMYDAKSRSFCLEATTTPSARCGARCEAKTARLVSTVSAAPPWQGGTTPPPSLTHFHPHSPTACLPCFQSPYFIRFLVDSLLWDTIIVHISFKTTYQNVSMYPNKTNVRIDALARYWLEKQLFRIRNWLGWNEVYVMRNRKQKQGFWGGGFDTPWYVISFTPVPVLKPCEIRCERFLGCFVGVNTMMTSEVACLVLNE